MSTVLVFVLLLFCVGVFLQAITSKSSCTNDCNQGRNCNCVRKD